MFIQLCIAYGYFHATIAQLTSRDGDGMGHKSENVYYVVHYRKSLPITSIYYYTLVTNLSITKYTRDSFLCNNHIIQDT